MTRQKTPDNPPPVIAPNGWRSRLLYEWKRNTRLAVACQANVTTILRHHDDWRGVLAFDEFSERIITLREPPWLPDDMPQNMKPGPWTDGDSRRLLAWLARAEKIHVSIGDVEGGLSVAADGNRINPVRDYLDALAWDGTNRLDVWLVDYFGCEDTPYTRGVGYRWLVGCVARGYKPGCQFDTMLILHGASGAGKSSGFRALVPSPALYSETGISIGEKDSYDALRGIWIYLLDELESLSRAETARVKTFLTSVKDHYREAYARRGRDFFRQTGFAGTTDNPEPLKDAEGRRRYWVVDVVKPIKVDRIAADRDQLWAEARARFQAGVEWHANTSEFRKLCDEQADAHTVTHPWEAYVAEWLANPRDAFHRRMDLSRGVLTRDVLEYALGISRADQKKAQEMDVARILVRLGYERLPLALEGSIRVRRYQQNVAKVVQVAYSGPMKSITSPPTPPNKRVGRPMVDFPRPLGKSQKGGNVV